MRFSTLAKVAYVLSVSGLISALPTPKTTPEETPEMTPEAAPGTNILAAQADLSNQGKHRDIPLPW
jgi:hypothetical protein